MYKISVTKWYQGFIVNIFFPEKTPTKNMMNTYDYLNDNNLKT